MSSVCSRYRFARISFITGDQLRRYFRERYINPALVQPARRGGSLVCAGPQNCLQRLAQSFTLFLPGVARNGQRFVQRDFTSCKRERNLEPIPALHTDLSRGIARDGNDWQACHLGERDDPFLDNIPRASGTVRRDRDVIAHIRMSSEFKERLSAPATARTAHLRYAKSTQHGGEHCAVFAGADQSSERTRKSSMHN